MKHKLRGWMCRRLCGLVFCLLSLRAVPKGPAGEVEYQAYRDLPGNGDKVEFAKRDGRTVGTAWRTEAGTTRVQIEVGTPAEARKDYEKSLRFSGKEYGLDHYDRSHAVGAGLGVESPYGIFLAPEDVNRKEQSGRIERDIAEIFKQRKPGVVLTLTVDVAPYEGTMRLKEAVYRLDATMNGKPSEMVYGSRVTVLEDGSSKVKEHYYSGLERVVVDAREAERQRREERATKQEERRKEARRAEQERKDQEKRDHEQRERENKERKAQDAKKEAEMKRPRLK